MQRLEERGVALEGLECSTLSITEPAGLVASVV